MSASKAIVILANSVRSGHRCVAGKELIRDGDGWEVGPWIRLTDPGTKDGSVRYELTRCRGGEEVGVLDVVEVPMRVRSAQPLRAGDLRVTENGIPQTIREQIGRAHV